MWCGKFSTCVKCIPIYNYTSSSLCKTCTKRWNTCNFMNIIRFDYFEKIVNHLNIEILDHGIVNCDATWNYKNISSPFNRLYFILDGEGEIENSSHKFTLTPERMYLIPLNSTYDYVCNNSMKLLYIHFRLELFFGKDVFEQHDSCLSMPVDNPLVEKSLEKINSTHLWDILYFKSILLETLSNFLPLIPNSLDTHINNAFKYQELFRYVKENCSAKLTLNQVSTHANMSIFTFQSFLKSILDYLQENTGHKINFFWRNND